MSANVAFEEETTWSVLPATQRARSSCKYAHTHLAPLPPFRYSNKTNKPKDFQTWKPGKLTVEHELKKKPMATGTLYSNGVLSRTLKMEGTEWTVRFWTSKGKLVEECFYKDKDIYYVFTWNRIA